MSVCLSVCQCVHVFTFEVPFKHLFVPISWSRMSNIFRDSISLGKSNGKKWSQIWTFLFGSSLKMPNKKIVILADFWVFAFWMIFTVKKISFFWYSWSTLLWYWCYYPHWSRDAFSTVCGIFTLKFERRIKNAWLASRMTQEYFLHSLLFTMPSIQLHQYLPSSVWVVLTATTFPSLSQ